MIAEPSVKVGAMEPKRFLVRVHIVNDELTIPLPKEIREELGLQEGDELDMRIEPGQITLTPVPKGPGFVS
jgi:AbrB family looped-hinge helix DNA binding protein